MPFLVNLCLFVVITAALTGTLTLPFMNLHMANASLAVIKTEVNEVIADNRNSLEGIETKIQSGLTSHKGFELVSVNSTEENDFKVIELEFKYKVLFQDINNKVENQKLRFIVNNV